MTTLKEHLAKRPELPRPYNPNSKEAKAHQKAFQAWVEKKERLECAERIEAMNFSRQTPIVSPKADYQWRDVDAAPRKRQRPPRPAWSGSTPEYNAQKARESRERKKAERMAAIREALNERGAA